MMLIFKSNGRANYSIEAFILLAQHKFLLSPRERASTVAVQSHMVCLAEILVVIYTWNT